MTVPIGGAQNAAGNPASPAGLADPATGVAPAPAGTIAGQTPADTGPVDLQAQIDELRKRNEAQKAEYDSALAEADGNFRGLQASLQRQIADVQKEGSKRTEYWENQYHQAMTQGMDEGARAQYEKDVLEGRLQQAQQNIASMELQAQEAQGQANLMAAFLQLDVPVDQLVLNQGTEALNKSGWDYFLAERSETKKQLADIQTQLTALQNQGFQPPPQTPAQVAVGQGDLTPPAVVGSQAHLGPGVQTRTWKNVFDEVEARTGYRPKSAGEVMDLVNKQQLPQSILPGLEGGPPQ